MLNITKSKLLGLTSLTIVLLMSNANAEYYIAGPESECFECVREVTVYHPYHRHHKHRIHHYHKHYYAPVRHSSASISVYYNFPAPSPCACAIPGPSCCPYRDSSYYYGGMYPNRYIYDDDYNWDRRTFDDVGVDLDVDY